MSRPGNTLLLLAVVGAIILAAWLSLGVFRSREWSGWHLFVKHRPTGKLIFIAPRGESDQSMVPGHEGHLSPEEEKEEAAFVEFVERQEGWRRSISLPFP